jgi:hypothetical protein
VRICPLSVFGNLKEATRDHPSRTRERLPCHQRGRLHDLKTETESNVRLYERFGFRTVKTIALPELNLPMWEMVREPDR